jgi:hypothetical protein
MASETKGRAPKDLVQTCTEGSSPSQTQSRQLRASLEREKYTVVQACSCGHLLLRHDAQAADQALARRCHSTIG